MPEWPFPFLDCQRTYSPAWPQQLLSQSLWNAHCDAHTDLWVSQVGNNYFPLNLALRITGDPVIIINGTPSEDHGTTAWLGLGGTAEGHLVPAPC